MVSGANKSGSRRKVFVRTRTGTKEVYKERKPSAPSCACGRPLPGTARGTRNMLNKMSKTEKRPSRPFGGQLCAVCTKAMFRNKVKELSLE